MSDHARKTVIVLAGHILGGILGYVVLLAVGRYYPPASYGSYLFAMGLVGLAAILGQAGLPTAHTREVARGVDLSQALGVMVRLRLLATLLFLLLVGAGLGLFLLLKGDFTDATTLPVIGVVTATVALAQWRAVATSTWTGRGQVHRVEWASLTENITVAVLVALNGAAAASAAGRWVPAQGLADAWAGLVGIDADLGIDGLALAIAGSYLAGQLLAGVLNVWWWLQDRVPVGAWDRDIARDYIRLAIPFALTGVLGMLLGQTDVLMLGYFWEAKQVGLYGAAKKLAAVCLIANTAILGKILLPRFSHLLGSGHGEHAMEIFRSAEKFLLLFVIPPAVGLIVWAKQTIHIAVGDGFIAAAAAAQWLAVWTIISAMNGPVRAKLMAGGHARLILHAATINVGANILLNLVLIPTSLGPIPTAGLGPEGAAIATAISTLLAFAHNRWHAHRHYDMPLWDRVQTKMLLAATVLGATWWALADMLPPTATDRFYEMALIGLLGMVLYVLLLFVLRVFGERERDMLRRAINPAGLLREVRGR